MTDLTWLGWALLLLDHGARPVVGLPLPGAGSERPMLAVNAGGHAAPVETAAFLPGGDNIVTISRDHTVRLWDRAGGETLQVYRLPADSGPVAGGALAPDGRLVAVAGRAVYLLSLESGQLVAVLPGAATAVQFAHNGRMLAATGTDGAARLVDVKTSQVVRTLQGHAGPVRRVAFAPDDRWLATAGADGTVCLWSTADGRRVARLDADALSLAWRSGEPLLAVGGVDGTIRLFTADGKPKQTLRVDPTEAVSALAFAPDGRLLYGGRDGHAGILDLKTGKRIVLARLSGAVHAVGFSADGAQALTVGGDRHEAHLWDAADGTLVRTLGGAGRPVGSVAWRSDGRAFAWGHGPTGALEQTFLLDTMQLGAKPDAVYRGACHRRDGWELRQLGPRSVVILKDGQPPHEVVLDEPERVHAMTLLADGQAVLGTTAGLRLVELATGNVARALRGHDDAVLSVAATPDGRHFLSGSRDQTIALWEPRRAEPLVRFFAAGRDWVAWTPAGHYSCSPYGERLFGWHVDQGSEQLAAFHPAARYRVALHQPNLVRYLLTDKRPGRALALASLDRAEPSRLATPSAALPPAVALVTPAEGTVQRAAVSVQAKARGTGAQPIAALRLLVDGRPYLGDKGIRRFEPPVAGEVDAAWSLELPPGKHLLAAVAESPLGKGVSRWVEVTRAAAAPDERPRLFVLAVGVAAYRAPNTLTYANKDAVVLEKLLRAGAAGVYQSVETKLLVDAQATRQHILDGLAWLQRSAGPGDVALVFLAGHGTRDAQGRFQFLPIDFDDRDLGGTTVGADALKQRLARIPGRVVLILNSCHSGAASRLKRARTEELVRDLAAADAGVVVLCSSQGAEPSWEGGRLEHGHYTASLVEALSGRADFNHDGYLYLHELEFYAYHRVRQLSGGVQNPMLGWPAHLRSFPLARVR